METPAKTPHPGSHFNNNAIFPAMGLFFLWEKSFAVKTTSLLSQAEDRDRI
jgi:hypothetical protein